MAKIRVFLAWSGEASREAAKVFHQWLPSLVPGATPWMSEVDISAGNHWRTELQRGLAEAKYGVVFVGPDVKDSTWLHYEAGSIDARLDGKVCPYLLGMNGTDLSGPMSSLQAVEASSREQTEKLLHSINEQTEEKQEANTISQTLEVSWTRIDQAIQTILGRQSPSAQPRRGTEELLREILSLVRDIDRRLGSTSKNDLADAIQESLQTRYVVNVSDLKHLLGFKRAPFDLVTKNIFTKENQAPQAAPVHEDQEPDSP